jgi:hypothetical protein
MSRLLKDLNSRFYPSACELLAKLTEAQIPVLITCTLRTQAEQDAAVASGHSQVAHSRHQDGMAIDIVPYDIWQEHGDDKLQWDTTDLIWLKIGAIAEALDLRWGGRFHPLNNVGIGWDPGHIEIPVGR